MESRICGNTAASMLLVHAGGRPSVAPSTWLQQHSLPLRYSEECCDGARSRPAAGASNRCDAWSNAQVAAVETHWHVWQTKGTSCTQTIACTRITRADYP